MEFETVMATRGRDPGLFSKAGRRIKLTEKAAQRLCEERQGSYEHAFRRLYGEMQDTFGLIQTRASVSRVQRHYKKWLIRQVGPTIQMLTS